MRKGILTKIVVGIILASIMVTAFIITINEPWQDNKQIAKKPLDFESGKPMIGFSIDALIIERWQRDIDIFKTKAEELGFEVEVANAYESVQTQIDQIGRLVDEGAVAIVIIAHDKDALVDVVDEAKKQGVMVIAYDRLINNANVDAYVSFDNVLVGELMGQGIYNSVPEGNYIIINGSPLDNNSTMFNKGYMSILQPHIDSGTVNVIEEVWAEDWREDIAYEAVRRKLEEDIEIDAVLAANDLLAEGAISALSEYGLAAGEVKVVGHDADISACQRIVEGKQLMTVYKPLKNLAEGAVELVYAMLKEEAVEFDEYIDDGTYSVPFVKFDVIAVNEGNMRDTVIRDFFHREEDVYRFSE